MYLCTYTPYTLYTHNTYVAHVDIYACNSNRATVQHIFIYIYLCVRVCIIVNEKAVTSFFLASFEMHRKLHPCDIMNDLSSLVGKCCNLFVSLYILHIICIYQ